MFPILFWILDLCLFSNASPLLTIAAASGKSILSSTQKSVDFQPLQVSNVSLACDRLNATAPFFCEVELNMHDPNSELQNRVTSCACNVTWAWDGATDIDNGNGGSSYKICWMDDETFFEMRLLTFQSVNNFSMELAHSYKDDVHFTKPWDHPTIFALADLHLPVVKNEKNKIGVFDEGPIDAPVFMATL
ncbi:hypothetical protein B0H63DRAFT_514799 [Podospora didyma]|uniref:Uncharacterized protein n=1 Tax=Podospora didyma TaxID=330526 RepID=A0AAE0K156_9PEZI|nr:hypothetical protein B0H63DRAFT_514799 [Podospora didyma]